MLEELVVSTLSIVVELNGVVVKLADEEVEVEVEVVVLAVASDLE
jgi:hypothetical protein